MGILTITPFKEGMDMEQTKREMDIHADGYRQGMKDAIEGAWKFFKHDVRINHIHTFGKEPSQGLMDRYKELFVKFIEESI